jgi:agarase
LSVAVGISGRRIKSDLDAFDGVVAERYFSVCANAIRHADSDHLILGCRFHALGVTPEIIKTAGRYNDVVSINYYYLIW